MVIQRQKTVTLLLYLLGLLIIIVLVSRLPLNEIIDSVAIIGPVAGWLLLIPSTWVIPDAIALRLLLGKRITLHKALYAQISGDALNSITPFISIGGEPYKAGYLSSFVSLEDASHAILISRLINTISGALVTAIFLVVAILIVDLSDMPGFAAGLFVVSAFMFFLSYFLLCLVMSTVPSRMVSFILSKLRLANRFQYFHVDRHILWSAMAYKMIGRGGKFLELYLIFLVLNIIPSFEDVVLVEAMIMASVGIFFFVPQGMGVNEAAIVTAFSILGYSAASGLVYGLIRRARIVAYTVCGLLINLVFTLNELRKSHITGEKLWFMTK